MDKKVNNFFRKIPKNRLVIDVGGCWGWHWRNISKLIPDVKIVIVDFIKSNLRHAQKYLKKYDASENIYLAHGDATNLSFKDNTFDGYWAVQTLNMSLILNLQY